MADAQERPTGNVTHSRGFDDQRCWLALSESTIPIEIVLGHKSVFGRAPGDHCRHPGPALERERSDLNRLKQE